MQLAGRAGEQGLRPVPASPALLSPEQGADTIVWLATAPHARLGSGLFWHDRRVRPEYTLPWTREKRPLPLPPNCGTTWTR